jgi:hypothetical protein
LSRALGKLAKLVATDGINLPKTPIFFVLLNEKSLNFRRFSTES